MKKRLAAVLLTVVMTLCVAACGSDKEEMQNQSPSTVAEDSNTAEIEQGLTLNNVAIKINGVEIFLPCTYSDFASLVPTLQARIYSDLIIEPGATGTLHMNNDGVNGFKLELINSSNEAVTLDKCDVYGIWFGTDKDLDGYTIELPYGVVCSGEGNVTYNADILTELPYLEEITDEEGKVVMQYLLSDDGSGNITNVSLFCNNGARPEQIYDFVVDVTGSADDYMYAEEEGSESVNSEAEEITEAFEGHKEYFTLYNETFKKREVSMYTPVDVFGSASDVLVHGEFLNDANGYLIIGGQVSMGAPKCEDVSNILEFYVEQIYERIDSRAAKSVFQADITSKEEMTFNEHSMYKYNGVIKKSVSSTKVLEYPFVAYATTAEDTSIYWLLADYSENKDQMELLEKQALTMAESYTVE